MDSFVISSMTQPHLPILFMVLPLVTPRLVYFETGTFSSVPLSRLLPQGNEDRYLYSKAVCHQF